MKNYDVIVIGSGNGGLAAACKILSSGKTCLVLEKHNIPGGFATSFRRGRFEFEASLHEFNGIGKKDNLGSAGKMFKELGVYDKIDFHQIHNAYRLISKKEKIDFTMPIGKEKCIAACKKVCRNGDKYAKQLFDLAENVYYAMAYISKSHGKPDPKIMASKYYDYLASSSYSVNEVYEALKIPQVIQDIFNAYWSYLGAPMSDMNFTHYANMVYSYFVHGAVVPNARSHELSLAFVSRIYELGGEIYFNSEVVKILTDKNNHVCGVKLKNGDIIKSRHVIADCSPHTVYGRLLDKKVVPEKAYKICNFRKFAGRGFTIFLGLNKSPKELGLTDHSYFIYDSSDSDKSYKNMGKLYHHVGQASVVLNNAVPNASPIGTTILYITTLFSDDCWKSVKENEYFLVKNKQAHILIKQFEEATHTNIHDHIEEMAVATPLTYAHYCLQPQGTIYGYHSQYRDGLMPRIMMVNDDALISGLRIGGGYGERLLGYPSSYKSGYNEASRTLKDIEKEGR